jgi:hypothetical protein
LVIVERLRVPPSQALRARKRQAPLAGVVFDLLHRR